MEASAVYPASNGSFKRTSGAIDDEEDNDLQEAILASLAEQSGITSIEFIEHSGQAQEYFEDSWSTDSGGNEISATSSPKSLPPLASPQLMDSEDSSSDEEEQPVESEYYPATKTPDEIDAARNEGIYEDCQKLLTLLGLPYLVAPGEAEAQCVKLESLGLVDGVVSDDSDVWLFGAQCVFKNLFSRSAHVEEYNANRIQEQLGLTREEFIQIGMLSGGDYTRGFDGVGIVTALELLAEFKERSATQNEKGIECLERIRDWLQSKRKAEGQKFTESSLRIRLRKLIEKNNESAKILQFPNPDVFDAYANPNVDDSEQRFSWTRVNFTRLGDFLMVKLGPNMDRVDQSTHNAFRKWDEFMSQATREYQPRITTFFSAKASNSLLNSNDDIMPSRRVNSALQRLKNANGNGQSNTKEKAGGTKRKTKEPRAPTKRRRGGKT